MTPACDFAPVRAIIDERCKRYDIACIAERVAALLPIPKAVWCGLKHAESSSRNIAADAATVTHI